MQYAPSAIEVLQSLNPSELDRLKAEFPNSPQVFTTERELGENASNLPIETSDGHRAAMLALTSVAAKELQKDIAELLKHTHEAMKKARTMRLYGAIIATVSGSVSGLAPLWWPGTAAVVTSFIAAAGGILGLLADQFERSPNGVKFAGIDEYSAIVDAKSAVASVQRKLLRDKFIPLSLDEIKGLLEVVDAQSIIIQRLSISQNPKK